MHPVARRLLAWYAQNKRDLTWRKTRDPYRIFISELMLQQTQVDRVLPKYKAFIRRFRTWKALADATTSDVINAWAGLGYNRRALYAREAAKHVVAYGVPFDGSYWLRLKGVGPYMAAALTEFVNGKRALVIDTNIRRVIGRVALERPYPVPLDDPRILNALERITPTSIAHRDFPQAAMDLANAICHSRVPECAHCPLRTECLASKKFLSGDVPVKRRTPKTERVHAEKRFPDRIYRGRILAWVRTHGPTKIDALGLAIDKTFDRIADLDWLHAMVGRLIKDGLLVRRRGDIISLPRS